MSNKANIQSGSDANKKAVVQGEWLDIPLSLLVPSELNARKAALNAAGVAELAALIASQGLINPPTVIAQMAGKKATGYYEVIAGSRRLAALTLLVEQGRYGADEPIMCQLRQPEDATAVSTAENAGRVNLHPADEFDAFKAMLDENLSVEDIAARFGVSELTVKQRLRLANVAPEFVALFRNDQVGMDVMKALALTTDHAAQRRVWKEVGNSRNAYVIRRALTQGEVEASDPVARFVGAKAFEKAGGVVRRDLFDREQSGYFTDRALLEKLARGKLEKAAASALADGAAWADIILQYDASARSEYVAVTKTRKKPTAKQQATLDALQAEQATCEVTLGACSEDEEAAADEALDAVYAKIEAIENALLVDDPNQLEKAGVVVTIDHSGKLLVMEQLLRKADAKALRTSQSTSESGAANPSDDSGAERDVSDSLARRLSVERTLALQVELSRRPDVALVAITAELASKVFRVRQWVDAKGWWGDGVGVSVQFERMPNELADDESTRSNAGVVLKETYALWLGQLREHAPTGDVLAWVSTLPVDRVLDLLAFCTAVRTDATVLSASTARVAAESLAEAVALDMHGWWTPTAENYFGKLPKPKIIEAIEEITGAPADADVVKMKKGAMAAHAAQLVETAGGTWLPRRMTLADNTPEN